MIWHNSPNPFAYRMELATPLTNVRTEDELHLALVPRDMESAVSVSGIS